MRRSAEQTRELVLEVAHQLFYWHGIRATGVDRVAAEAGVAPTTLYRLFSSKDDLVAAYIDRAFRLYRDWFDAAAAAGGAAPRDRILAVFDALAEQVQPHQCRGCPFLMALAELWRSWGLQPSGVWRDEMHVGVGGDPALPTEVGAALQGQRQLGLARRDLEPSSQRLVLEAARRFDEHVANR